MDAGETLDLDVTDVAHGGVFVARHEGRVIFLPDAIPGERVRARLSETSKKSFWRAETIDVLDASPHRRPHVWSAADVTVAPDDRPGGADFGHIELSHQRGLKLQVVHDALRRIGRLETSVTMQSALPVVEGDAVVDAEHPDATRWRTRVSLHVDAEGRIGPFAPRSHRVIPVDDLPLATAEIEEAARGLTAGEPGRIDLVQPADGRVRVLRRPDGVRTGAVVSGVLTERVADRRFLVSADGFWQVHRLAAHSLTRLVGAELREARADGVAIDPDAWHLDLYGGVGLFAAALGELGGPATRVTSVESHPRATELARENLAEWAGARAETARVDRFLGHLARDASPSELDRLSRGVVLLDPPRAGAGRGVAESIASLHPAAVVYVACDPVALARDLATFRLHGYEARRGVHAVDLFPHSHHVEAVAVLTR